MNDTPFDTDERPGARAAQAEAGLGRYAAGKVIVGVRAGHVEPSLVTEALAEALRVDIAIDRIALRERLQAQGVPGPEAWRIALEARIVEDSVSLMTRNEAAGR